MLLPALGAGGVTVDAGGASGGGHLGYGLAQTTPQQLGHQKSLVTSLSLSFLVCEMGTMKSTY